MSKMTTTAKTKKLFTSFLAVTVLTVAMWPCSASSGAVTKQDRMQRSPAVVLDAPDIGLLEHIREEYVTSCRGQQATKSNWEGYEEDLKQLNARTFAVVKELEGKNKVIRKTVRDISRALAKINTAVVDKDIRRTKKKVLREMEGLKKQLGATRESIEKIRNLVDQSQKSMGDTYCRIDQYVTMNQGMAESFLDREMNKTAATYEDTAADMSIKRKNLFAVMQEFDRYFGLLDQLFTMADHKLLLIDAVQNNVVAYVDTYCRDKSTPCKYQVVSDLRFDEVELAGIMAKIEEAFARLITSAQARFSGSSSRTGQEVGHVAN